MNDPLRLVRDLTPSGPRGLRRRWVVPTVAALVATGAIGTAATTLLGDSSETTSLEGREATT